MRWIIAFSITAGLIAVMVAIGNPIVSVLIVLATAIWATVDSAYLELDKYNGGVGHPALVFIGIMLLWVLLFPAYLVTRSRRVAGELKLKKKYREQLEATDVNARSPMPQPPTPPSEGKPQPSKRST